MSFEEIELHHVRNITHAKLNPVSRINGIIGNNGSGKTSLLEAIHLLGSAKSFRTHHISSVIQHGNHKCTVFGLFRQDSGIRRIGVEKEKSTTRMKLDDEWIHRNSDLSMVVPIQVLTPTSHEIMESGPKYRRHFIDWGVFHVEHDYFENWKTFHRILRQRNASIRQHYSKSVITSWDSGLIESANYVNDQRNEYVLKLQPIFQEFVHRFFEVDSVGIVFDSGWSNHQTYSDALQSSLDSDMKLGHTKQGPHRADFLLKLNGINAYDYVSRGQQKLLIACLKLAQMVYLKQQVRNHSILLVDDLPAELDSVNRQLLLRLISEIDVQVFMTSITDAQLDYDFLSHMKMFHVEHGSLTS